MTCFSGLAGCFGIQGAQAKPGDSHNQHHNHNQTALALQLAVDRFEAKPGYDAATAETCSDPGSPSKDSTPSDAALSGAGSPRLEARGSQQSDDALGLLRPAAKAAVGLVSGAGPEVGVDLLQKVLQANRDKLGDAYASDRDAPHVVLVQAPGIGAGPGGKRWCTPGAGLADAAGDFDLCWGSLCAAVEQLERCGVTKFGIGCNTLHVLAPKLKAHIAEHKLQAQLVSVIDCVGNALAGGAERVAVFGTMTTTDLAGASPYGQLRGRVQLVDLDLPTRQRLQALVGDVKRFGPGAPGAGAELNALLRATDADVVVLACTELPLLLSQITPVCRVLDPGQLLAEALLE